MLEHHSNCFLAPKDIEMIDSYCLAGKAEFKKLLGKGHASIVFLVLKNKKKTAVKIRRKKSSRDNLEKEFKMLKKLNKHKIGPKVFSFSKKFNAFSMEFIDGIPLRDFLKTEKNQEKIQLVFKRILSQAKKLDELKITHKQLGGKLTNILVSKNLKITIIDFEKAIENSKKEKNVNQFKGRLYSLEIGNKIKLIGD